MDIQITHKNCNDGFHAYLVARLAFPKIKCYFASYNDDFDVELVRGKDVLITDFSFKRDKLLELKSVAKSVVLIDHHKSAMEEVGDLDFCHFDMEHSGAVLTWMKLFPGDRIPRILLYVEDRDLWRFKLPRSRAVSSYMVNSNNYEIERDFLANVSILEAERSQTSIVPGSPPSNREADLIQDIADVGTTYLKIIDLQVERTCRYHGEIVFQGARMAIVNASSFHSEIGDYLSKIKIKDKFKYDAAMIWCTEADGGVKVSMRSASENPNAADVSAIALKVGGGGHKHAAGFYTSLMAMDAIIKQKWHMPEE